MASPLHLDIFGDPRPEPEAPVPLWRLLLVTAAVQALAVVLLLPRLAVTALWTLPVLALSIPVQGDDGERLVGAAEAPLRWVSARLVALRSRLLGRG